MSKRNNTYYILACFFICFIPRILINLGIKASTGGHDDLGFLAVSSYLVGYDWSGLIQHTSYYGFGFSVLFMTPIIKLFGGNTFLMFQIMWAVIAAFQSLVAVMVYYIAHYLFGYKDKNFCALAGIIISYLTFCSSCRLENDAIMPLFIWGIILILSLLIKSEEHKILKTVCLVLTVAFLQLMHTRSIILWIALVAVIGLYRIMEKKWLVSPIVYLIGMFGSIYLVKKTIAFVQNTVWGTTDLPNSSTGLKNQLITGATTGGVIDYIRSFVLVCFGELFTIIQFSNILFAVGLFSVLVFLFNKIKREEKKVEFYNLVFLVILSMGMLGASGLYWNEDARNSLLIGADSKGFFYLRYISTFAIPIVFWGIAYIREIDIKQMAMMIFLYIALCQFVVSNIGVLPTQDAWATFASKYGGNFKSILSQYDLLLVSIVSLAVFFVYWLLNRGSEKTRLASMILLTLVTFCNYTYQVQNGAKMWGDSVYNSIDAISEVNVASFENVNVYCNDDIQKYALQLAYPKMPVKDFEDYMGERNSIIISRDREATEETDLYYILSDDEIIYFSDIATKNTIMECLRK